MGIGVMTVAQELLALTDESGFIKPHSVVEWARENPDSELHKRLEWDDGLAAEEWRLWQVRHLIAVNVVSDEGKRVTISLVQDRHSDGGYRCIDQVMSNAELRALALSQALAEFRVWQRKYQYLRELAQIFEAADQVEGGRVSGRIGKRIDEPVE